jgi:glycosyltransferase involved in cell wall biosynthesis
MASVSVVIPVFNEAPALNETLERFERALKAAANVEAFELILVDDGSTDGAIDALPPLRRAMAMRHEENRGYGASLKTGIRQARYPLVAICDADGSYEVEAVPELLAAWKAPGMVVARRRGIRYLRGHALKSAMRAVFRAWLFLLTFRDIPDVNSGLRVFERERVLPLMGDLSERFSFTTGLTLQWALRGWPIVYVDTPYAARKGSSKVRFFADSARVLWQTVRLRVKLSRIFRH